MKGGRGERPVQLWARKEEGVGSRHPGHLNRYRNAPLFGLLCITDLGSDSKKSNINV